MGCPKIPPPYIEADKDDKEKANDNNKTIDKEEYQKAANATAKSISKLYRISEEISANNNAAASDGEQQSISGRRHLQLLLDLAVPFAELAAEASFGTTIIGFVQGFVEEKVNI